MIKLNETYSINDGQESIVFAESKGNSISGKYESGTLTGTLEGDLLKATYHNKKTNVAGLIEIEFNESGFIGKWKQGLELGPMKGKWVGKLKDVVQNKFNPKQKSTNDFIEYVKSAYAMKSAYEGKIEATTDFVEDYSLEFDNDFFGDLKDNLDVVVFRVDNSEYSIDERDGRDTYTIFYDFKNNCIYKQNPNESDEYYCFLDTWHASIPSNYKESKNFYGCYSISDLHENWTINFHGDFESASGEIDQKIINEIKNNINGSSFFNFLKEVLESM